MGRVRDLERLLYERMQQMRDHHEPIAGLAESIRVMGNMAQIRDLESRRNACMEQVRDRGQKARGLMERVRALETQRGGRRCEELEEQISSCLRPVRDFMRQGRALLEQVEDLSKQVEDRAERTGSEAGEEESVVGRMGDLEQQAGEGRMSGQRESA